MRNATRVALIVCCAVCAFAREESSRDFRKSVALAGGRGLRVEHSLGNIVIHTQPKGEVEVLANIRCSAETADAARACVDGIKVTVEETSSGVLVRTDYPEHRNERNISYGVRYDITMPETAPLDLRNRFGGVEVTNLHASAVVSNANGAVRFSGGRGRQRIDNSFGAVDVIGNDGDVTVVNQNGNVTVSDVTGALEITNRFGATRATNTGRGLTIRSNNGSIEAVRVGGPAVISTSFGRVAVSDVKSDLRVDNQNGEISALDIIGTADLHTSFASVKFSRIGKTVTVRAANSSVTGDTVAGSATIETSFGTIDLRGIKGGARAVGGNSGIRLSGIGGEAYAKTSFGGVSMDDIGGPISVEDQNGSVTVASRPGQRCQPIVAQTSFSPIRVTVPPGAGYNVTAKTSFGRIHSEPEMTVSGALGADSVNGKIGSGGCELRLTDQNGNIDILKAR